MITQNPCRHVGYFLFFFKIFFAKQPLFTTSFPREFAQSVHNRIDQRTLAKAMNLQNILVPIDQGTPLIYYSLNNPLTDARYSGQLSESSSLIA